MNVIRNHFVAAFLYQDSNIWFPLGPWPMSFQVLGYSDSVGDGFSLME